MLKLSAMLVLLFFAGSSFAQDSVVRWKTIVGVITAPGIQNPVAGIASGGLPWATTGGSARVNLANGDIGFRVEGLTLVGGNATGTPGPVSMVKGTLVCNAGKTEQAILDTPNVPLNSEGDAEFAGNLGSMPSPCNNPLFLVRFGAPTGPWLATGLVRTMGGENSK